MKINKFLLLCLSMFLVACGGGSENPTSSLEPTTQPVVTTPVESTSSSNNNTTTPLLNFENVKFESQTIEYDGKPHTLVVEGAPIDANISYTNNGPFVDHGTYKMFANISKEGYKTLELSATLIINKSTITGVEFKNQSFEYDGNAHSIMVDGVLPDDAIVSYYCDETESNTNSAVEVGEYTIHATITSKNYNDCHLSAILKIKADDDERDMIMVDDVLYFQNAKHNDYLYKYDENGVSKISSSVSENFVETENSISFINNSLFLKSISDYNFTNQKVDNVYNGIFPESMAYDGTYYYFTINDLFNSNKGGIYKLDNSGEEPVQTLVSEGNAKHLVYFNNQLYFADGLNDYKLSCVSINGGDRTLLVDEKINNLIYEDGSLYFTVNTLLDDYIAKYNLANNAFRKLTSDAGASLNVIDGDLYYVNVDLFSQAFIGSGIYKVSANPASDHNYPGNLVVEGETCSLYAKEGHLYFYMVENYQLIKYDIENETSIDLLKDFTKPEEKPLSLGSQTEAYGGKIYYLNLHDGKTLYSYNPRNGLNLKLTSEKVDSFSIVDNELYINTVSYLVNNDLYKIDLKDGGIPVLVSKNDVKEVVSDGNKLYYSIANAVGALTEIHSVDKETYEETKIFEKGASNLRVYENKLFFIDGKDICYLDLSSLDLSNESNEAVLVNEDYETTCFEIDNGVIYFRELYGLFNASKRLAKMNVDGSNYEEMVTEDTDPIEITVHDGYIYYVNETTVAVTKNGLYKVAINGKSATKLVDNKYYPSSISVLNDLLYFVDYSIGGLSGTSHLYSVSIKGGLQTPNKIA